jgi:hypothetical protein
VGRQQACGEFRAWPRAESTSELCRPRARRAAEEGGGSPGDLLRVCTVGIEHVTDARAAHVLGAGELVARERPHEQRNAGVERLGDGVVAAVADDEVAVGEDRGLREVGIDAESITVAEGVRIGHARGEDERPGLVPEGVGHPAEDVVAGGQEAAQAGVHARARERRDLGLEGLINPAGANRGPDEVHRPGGAVVPDEPGRVVEQREPGRGGRERVGGRYRAWIEPPECEAELGGEPSRDLRAERTEWVEVVGLDPEHGGEVRRKTEELAG